MAASPAAMTTIEKPAQTQMYAIMIAGVISFGPEPGDPPIRLCERVGADLPR